MHEVGVSADSCMGLSGPSVKQTVTFVFETKDMAM